jgi:hypothetical protein
MRSALLGFVLLAGGCSESNTPAMDSGITFDASFPDGAREDTGETPDAGPGESDIGRMCTGMGDCASGFCISADDGFPGGYCSAFCGSDEDCPSGAICLPVSRTESICLDVCDPDAAMRDCRAGYGCADSFELPAPVCLPGCTDDTDCPMGLQCDPAGGGTGEGACFDPSASLGDECESETECPSGAFCYGEGFAGWPGGSCISFGCDVEMDSGCDGDAHCIPSTMGGGLCFDGCTTSDDCRPSYACEGTAAFPGRLICQPACTDSSVCSEERVCNPGLGTCDEPFDVSDLGRACARMRDACDGGTCIREADSGFPGSYCIYVGCDNEAPDAMDGCPGDGICIDGAGGAGICIDGCTMPSDCRAGYSCRAEFDDADGGTGCFPGCTSDMDCANDGYVCNDGTGLCTEPFDTGALGDPCTGRDECVGGRCVSEAADGYPSGMCTYPGCRLSGMGPSEACPTGSACVDDGEGDPTLGTCVPTCTAPTGCRAGYTCETPAGGTGMVCDPQCTMDGHCSGGRTCDVPTGLCS